MKLLTHWFTRSPSKNPPASVAVPNRTSALATGTNWPVRPPVRSRWREQYNPLRGLDLPRAVGLLEAYQRGEMADLQWTYHFIEGSDADLFALIERRTSAILDLDWNVKMVSGQPKLGDGRGKREEGGSGPLLSSSISLTQSPFSHPGSLAAEQRAALREAYERVDNLYQAVEHLALATFRGFAHLEKQRGNGENVTHLELLDQWNVVRDGLRGAWKYNPEARSTNYRGLPEVWRLDPNQWIVREVKRHVNRIGLIKHVRTALTQRDWDAYLEIYGLPSVVITAPPNTTPEQQADFITQAEAFAKGESGALPNGATVQFANGPRQSSPFHEYLRYLSEQLILAGTGGVLTMLATSGTGTLAGSVHARAFEQIARSEARQISEVFQEQFDAALLDELFPGQPHLAYFELAAHQATDVAETVDHAVKLRQAGFQFDAAELSERTGYRLESAALRT